MLNNIRPKNPRVKRVKNGLKKIKNNLQLQKTESAMVKLIIENQET
jgi:hypothetical protein